MFSLIFLFVPVVTQSDEQNETVTQSEITPQNEDTTAYYPSSQSCKTYEYQDLRTSACMCDRNCWKYDDCCADAKHIHDTGTVSHQFTCEHTPSNGDIYMVSTCPSSWKETLIVEKCTTRNNTLYKDVLIGVTVTSAQTNITYRNVFCATCNYEKNLHFWNVTVAYERYLHLHETKYDVTEETIADVEGMLKNSHVNGSWFSNMGKNISYEPNVNPELPVSLQSRVRYCVLNVISKCLNSTIYCGKDTSYVYASGAVYKNQECAKCNGITEFRVESNDSHEKPNLCSDTLIESTTRSKEKFYSKDCSMYSARNNQECLIDRELEEELHFHYTDAETILFHKLNVTFDSSEWQPISNTTIYLCGTYRPYIAHMYFVNTAEYNIFRIASKMNIVLLVITLATLISANKLHTLHYKILIALCTLLLCTYLNCELIEYVSNYFLVSISLHYTFLCYSTWSFIAFCDCWYTICCASTKYQMLTRQSNTKKFFIYSIVAVVLPLAVILTSLFLEFAPTSLIPCAFKPRYGKRQVAFISNTHLKAYLFCFIMKGEYLLSFGLFAHTLYFICVNRKNGVKSNIPANYYVFFFKFAANLAFMYSSFAWSAFVFREESRCNPYNMVHGIVGGARGLFFYLAFAFPWKKVRELYEMCVACKGHRVDNPSTVGSNCSEKAILSDGT